MLHLHYNSTHLRVVSALQASLELQWALDEHMRIQQEQIDGGSQRVAWKQTGKDAEDPVWLRHCLLNCSQLHRLRKCQKSPAVAALARGRAVEDRTHFQQLWRYWRWNCWVVKLGNA